MNKKVLLVIDMQNDFITGSLGNKEATLIVPKVLRRVEETKANGEDIYFTMDTHDDNYFDSSEGKKLPIKHCIKGTWGHQICDELKKYVEGDKVIEKHSFGCKDIAKYFENYDEITLVGLCTDICVVSNAILLKSNFPSRDINVIKNLCAGSTVENHEAAIKVMAACHINIL